MPPDGRRSEPAAAPPLEDASQVDPGFPSLGDAEFALLRRLIRREAGISLNDSKKALLQGRLARRLRELGLRSYRAYYRLVVSERGDELLRMLDSVCTNETSFFRSPRHFDFLESRVFPAWSRDGRRTLRVWSAGCATGEEPYSLAMLLLDRFPPAGGWRVEVLATDLSTRALARARAGVWPIERAQGIPSRLLKAFMLRGVGGQIGNMKAGPELRAVIRFERRNLHDADDGAAGEFDLILCRNVLIYFDPEGRRQAVGRLLARLRPGGVLILGHAESLTAEAGARCVGPNAYERVHGRAFSADGEDGASP